MQRSLPSYRNFWFGLPSPLAVVLLAFAPLGLAQTATTIELEITGGPLAGNYGAVSDEPTCTYGYAGEGFWGNQYSISDVGPETFSSLQLIVDADAAAEGTDEFLVTVSFGEFFTDDETSYTVRSGDGSSHGTGTVTLDDRGGSATVVVSAVTQEGIGIEATIECHLVLRAGAPASDGEQVERVVGRGRLLLNETSFEFTPVAEEAWCEEGVADEHDFQYSYTPSEDDGTIYGIEFYLLDTRRLGSGEEEFYLAIYSADGDYYVDTMEGPDGGSASLSLATAGGETALRIDGVAAGGALLLLEVVCRRE